MTTNEGRVALITGAASKDGIGFATAKRLIASGATVVISDLSDDPLDDRARELGGDTLSLVHDVGDQGDWETVVSEVVRRFGRLDILVNNAGLSESSQAHRSPLAKWEAILRVNLTGVYLGCLSVMQQMRAQSGGAIVNLSSIAGMVGIHNAPAYTASKGGVRILTKTLALEGAPHGIRCNSVHPGVIATDMTRSAFANASEAGSRLNAAIPMGRPGTADEIAAAIAFLVSSDASYVTGAEFVVDGGFTAQ